MVDIKERAYNKIYAKIKTLEFNQESVKTDLKNSRYGAITKEEMQLIIKQNDLDLDMWNYLIKRI